MKETTCSCCGGTKWLRLSVFHGDNPICKPCFMIWYDASSSVDSTDPKSIGEYSLRMKAEGKWPWTREFVE